MAGKTAAGQPTALFDPAGQLVRSVQIQGLDQIEPHLVENSLRIEVGQLYDPQVVEADIVRINSLGHFGAVTAQVSHASGGAQGVDLVYQLEELPILTGVEIRGNRAIDRIDLMPQVVLRIGDPVDRFLIDRACRAISDAYEAEGYFVTDVSVDEGILAQDRRLVLVVREGPRIRIRGVHFEGNVAFPDKALRKQVKAKAWFPILGHGRVVNRDALQLDAAQLRDYYTDRGYLEAQVDRRIDVSPDQKDALVTFLIEEGPRWTVGDIRVESDTPTPLIFTDAQIRLNLAVQPGDAFSDRVVAKSIASIRNLYGHLGYLETRLVRRSDGQNGIDRIFNASNDTVDLVVRIHQGTPSTVGKVTVRGNGLTRTKVILRELRGLDPGRPFNRAGLDDSRRRLVESPLFRDGSVTVLGNPDDPQRDVLVEVSEQNTGEISLGATLSSDDGLLGAVSITQRNFDITDVPESWGDFLSNRAFRGGGQTFNLTLSPGSRNSQYSVGLSDPHFLDTSYFLSTELFFRESDRGDYEERRSGARMGLGHRFGDVWSAQVRARAENVRIRDVANDATLDVFDVEGTNLVTGASFRVIRNTTNSGLFPTRGSRTVVSVERVGTFGGDYDFTRAKLNYNKFWTMSTDVLDRRSVLRFSFEAGQIFEENESPIFERFYAGGHSSFRGFRNRGVGPRGIRANTLTASTDAVGGDFQLLTGLQYEVPLMDRILRGVIFTDQGLLTNESGLEPWRVSVGVGIRLAIPMLSQAPFALDLSIPLEAEDADQEQVLSFSLDIPFQ